MEPTKELTIPDHLSKEYLLEHSSHLAVRCAYKSERIKRSTNSATILLISSTGAGKSATVNNLLNSKVCKVGDNQSTTDTVEEFTILMPSEDIGALNTKIVVVDTPGLGDTNCGAQFDAATVHAVKEVFARKRVFPNFVFLVVNINDKRLEGTYSDFVKMLRIMKVALIGSVIDNQNTNVILVCTHLCSLVPKQRQGNELRNRVAVAQKLVTQYLGISPVYACVAENEAKDFGLDKDGDFYELPNGEFYPRNLFEEMIRCAKANGDLMGHALINEALRRASEFAVEQTRATKVTVCQESNRYLTLLLSNSVRETDSEISQLILEAQEGTEMKPEDAIILGNLVEAKGISNKADVPKTRSKVMQLLKSIRPNVNQLRLLGKALGLIAPSLDIDLFVGRGYNVSKDCFTNHSPVKLEKPVLCDIGCSLPSNIDASSEACSLVQCKISRSLTDHWKDRLLDLGVSGNITSFAVDFNHHHGYNIGEINNMSKLTAFYEKSVFKLRLNAEPITHEFEKAVNQLPDRYNEKNADTWRRFVEAYGTHYVKEVKLGGYIQFTLRGNSATSFAQEATQGTLNIKKLFCSAGVSWDSRNSQSSSFSSSEVEVEVYGGDSKLNSSLLSPLSPEQYLLKVAEWENSLIDNFVVVKRCPILEFNAVLIEKVRPEVAGSFREAVSELYKEKIISEIQNNTRNDLSQQNKVNDKSGCLSGETEISTPYGNVPISSIRPGDRVFSGTGEIVEVIGINKVPFPSGSKLYTFGSDLKPFFNGLHPFMSPEGDILVVHKKGFCLTNPQLCEDYQVREMSRTNQKVLHFDGLQLTTSEFSVEEFTTTEDTHLYFMAVSGEGTYVANGFVCHHEIPNFSAWPRTFYCILSVALMVPEQKYPSDERHDNHYQEMFALASRIGNAWALLDSGPKGLSQTPSLFSSPTEVKKYLAQMIQDSSRLALTHGLYVLCGRFLHQMLDIEGRLVEPFLEAAARLIRGML